MWDSNPDLFQLKLQLQLNLREKFQLFLIFLVVFPIFACLKGLVQEIDFFQDFKV